MFIGEVGVGKTTTICHILNLTRSAERTINRSSNSENRTRTVQYTKELLSTGSGRTTICEVVICPADTTFIEVVPAPLKRAQEFLDEFCEIIWQKVYPNNSARLEPLSAEVSRAVRNMVGLQEVTRDGDLTDTAQEFANQFEPDEYEKFRQAVLVRGALGER